MSDQTEAELEEFLAQLRGSGGFDDGDLRELAGYIRTIDQVAVPQELTETVDEESSAPAPEEDKGIDASNIRFQLANMSIPEKIKLAMFGNATCRSVLILDPNRIVSACVLKNPKLRLPEIEDFARNKNVSDTILRSIGNTGEWMRSYKTKVNLVSNPKTPQDLSLKWLRYLQQADIRKLSRSKNVPQLIATTARKLVAQQQKK